MSIFSGLLDFFNNLLKMYRKKKLTNFGFSKGKHRNKPETVVQNEKMEKPDNVMN
jgi:hypothetical protein